MSGLRTIAGTCTSIAQTLLTDGETESCAIGFAHHNELAGSWVLGDVEPVPEQAYAARDAVSASLKTDVVMAVANRARTEGLSPIFIHTHPFASGVPLFSAVDDAGEAELRAYLEHRAPNARALAMVIGPDGLAARELGLGTPVDVWDIGADVRLLSAIDGHDPEALHDRQLRAFGAAGQRMIAKLSVLVVGAGGTGSAVLQQLAFLGAKHLTIIDPDCIEATNLNRLIGAGPADIGRQKVEVAKRHFATINPDAQITAVRGDIVDEHYANLIAAHDIVFLCTDSHASRAVVCQAAYQHLVPVIDMGVSLTAREGKVSHITGRVQLLAPGQPCLVCTRALDGQQIQREMMTPQQRAADPYFTNDHEPQPAVVSINSTMASLAATMFLGVVTPIPAAARFQLYDGVRGTVRPTAATARADCIVCSPSGALARGTSWALPVRRGQTL